MMKTEDKKTFIEWIKEIREKGTPLQQSKKAEEERIKKKKKQDEEMLMAAFFVACIG